MAETDDSQEMPQSSPKARRPSSLKLRSLAPEYVENWHASYVRHLEEAVKDPRNRNIALTGRYGAGKSSVLDKFEEEHKDSTVRININTLGPDIEGEGLTNRIQKEMVKQLVYRAKAGQVRSSRFARTAPLTPKRAFWQACGGTLVAGALLWLAGLLPNPTGAGTSHHPLIQVAAWLAFVALSVVVVWMLRWLVGNRIVSGVATAGTSVTLQERPDTYFDKYLDELVSFFDQVSPDYVIFEDLDRFDDSHIFDSLRELNTLLNSSANRGSDKPPLRFIYAIKDSLFEQLGGDANDDSNKKDDAKGDARASQDSAPQSSNEEIALKKVDIAAAATERANRTKFFELVIPMVPFISHRNARDLLLSQLKKRGIHEDTLAKPLLGLVARHATDMRLLTNICNEFIVFAERLLWVDKPAPGLTEDHLFALVSFKNFHLADFEAIPARGSTLDEVERFRLDLVRASIKALQEEKRRLTAKDAQYRTREATAATLGSRLVSLGDALKQTHARHQTGLVFVTGDQPYTKDKVGGCEFWEDVAHHRTLTIRAQKPGNQPITLLILGAPELEIQFADGVAADRWAAADEHRRKERIAEIDELIPYLRGADFKDLIDEGRFTLKRPGFRQPSTFLAFVEETLVSDLARDLVRFGYIDRNFAEYASVFYGNFIGVDVANFYNRSVQPNTMYLDFKFSGTAAVKNLLAEVSPDFTSTLSALNLDVVTYLLNENDPRADEIVAHLTTAFSDEAQEFLETYLNEVELPRHLLVEKLARHPWTRLFSYLVTHPGLPDDDTRTKLVDAALHSAAAVSDFQVDDDVAQFLISNYTEMSAFTKDQTEGCARVTFEFAERAGLVVGELSDIGEPLRARIVAGHMYRLTADNLRTALSKTGKVPLNAVRAPEAPPAVWEYCRDNIDTYLQAVDEDDATQHAVESSSVLVELLESQHETWTPEQLTRLFKLCATTSAVPDLTELPDHLWQLLATSHLFVPTIANLYTYAQTHDIDQHLADFLTSGKESARVVVTDEDDTDTVIEVAATVLRASSVLDVKNRVALASTFGLPVDAIPLASVTPEADGFLAAAVEAGLFTETEDVFDHFLSAGWDAVEEAVRNSARFRELLTPARVEPVVEQLLASRGTPDEVLTSVLDRLGDFVPDSQEDPMRAAAMASLRHRHPLSIAEVRRVATVTSDPDLVVPLLAQLKGSATADVIAILVLLGHPYSLLQGGPGDEFELPTGDAHATVFERLHKARKVKVSKKRRLSSTKIVKVLV
ncbi:hypothetical protein EF847_15255 [Actinobacteria bacterium YIM 96077]|uniref:YobI-like P-loop NTPase domain-containing protein n=1 Tax=Phytoactinopolyspora halophila TaxID=1981511 RepID=A0A329QU74_9ACTN|nr:hypothetical protein [Phytoactinopolyspora halophila]AYY13855.1 hypothetical protein EF847_15255 [Actinobacteria bacterium YIM 96077]RAW15601.1 hypothetical protein DPM12_08085 [Phytoactinopolyspora halophila]